MKIETLKERIEKAEIRLEKKKNTIVRKNKTIDKKMIALEKLNIQDPRNADYRDHKDNTEAFWLLCDIKTLKEDIERLDKEIPEIEKTIEKYKAQLSGEIKRESIFLKEIPEIFKTLQEDLVANWDIWDINRRDNLKKSYAELGYKKFMESHTLADYRFKDLSDIQIKESNKRDAESLIMDLYIRVKDITGEVTDWTGIELDRGSNGSTVLNGVVYGKTGRAKVESILAGGYNIQRLHVRILVHSI